MQLSGVCNSPAPAPCTNYEPFGNYAPDVASKRELNHELNHERASDEARAAVRAFSWAKQSATQDCDSAQMAGETPPGPGFRPTNG